MGLLVVAPHPEDELLGCGGTLLRRKEEGCELGWLIVTGISEETGWSSEKIKERDLEIEKVREGLGVKHLYNLRLPTTKLDTIPMSEMIRHFSKVFQDFCPEEVFVPHRGDVNTDHQVVFDAVGACCKWFRYPSVKRVLAYETLSETEFGLNPQVGFQPNLFVDISQFLTGTLELLKIYQSELGEFPFPRSETAVRALAQYRGSTAGLEAAESFQMLIERTV